MQQTTFEELPHRKIVKTIGAVEHDALLSQGFRQILGRFCLSGTGRPGRGTAKDHLDQRQTDETNRQNRRGCKHKSTKGHEKRGGAGTSI